MSGLRFQRRRFRFAGAGGIGKQRGQSGRAETGTESLEEFAPGGAGWAYRAAAIRR